MSKFLLIGSVAAVLYGNCVWAINTDTSANCGCRSTLESLQEQISMEKTRRTQDVQAIKMQLNEEKYKRDQLEKEVQELQEEIEQAKRKKLEESKIEDMKDSSFKGFSINRNKTDFGKLQDQRGKILHSRKNNKYTELQASEYKGEIFNGKTQPNTLRHYKSFPNLKKMNISDLDLEYIYKSSLKFPKLNELTVDSEINEDNFSALMFLLSQAPNLNILNIATALLSTEHLEELKKFENTESTYNLNRDNLNQVSNDLENLSLVDRPQKKILKIHHILRGLKIDKFIGENEAKLNQLSNTLMRNPMLETLDLSGCGLTILPEAIGALKNLRSLNLSGNKLNKLPESIEKLANLEELYLDGNHLRSIHQILSLKNLKILSINISDDSAFLSANLNQLKEKNQNLKILTDSAQNYTEPTQNSQTTSQSTQNDMRPNRKELINSDEIHAPLLSKRRK